MRESVKRPALTPYDIGEIMTARMQGATCKVLGQRYGRSAEAIRQLIARKTEGSRKGRAGRPAVSTRDVKTERGLPKTVLSARQLAAIEELVDPATTPLADILAAVTAQYRRRWACLTAGGSAKLQPPSSRLERKEERGQRDLDIRLLALGGTSTEEIAARIGLTARRVRQILK